MMSRNRATRRSSGFRRSAGFTLVELMVALLLGAIIAVVISIISRSAQESYSSTVAKVDIYNRFRLLFQTVQKDFSGWIPTQEIEFYNDGRGGRPRDFHWQPGEEVQDRADENGDGQVDGGVYGEFDEYAFIEQKQYTAIELDDVSKTPKIHDAYHVYFRTMTYVDGAVREANVEYMLVDTSRPLEEWKRGVPPLAKEIETKNLKALSLYKIVRFYKINAKTITETNNYPIERRILEVSDNVTDFRVEYMSGNPYSSRIKTAFRTPGEDYAKPVERATRPLRIKVPEGRDGYRKIFGYGSMSLDVKYPLATAFTASWGDNRLRSRQRHEPVRFGFQRDPNISFAELNSGDKIFIFNPGTMGSNVQSGSVASLVRFPRGGGENYTVKANLNGLIEFVEDIDASTWNEKDQRPIHYKAAFMPSALRITIRMVDEEGRSPKSMQQVIWLRRKNR